MKNLIFLLAGIISFLLGCSHEPKPVNPSPTKTKTNILFPIATGPQGTQEVLNRKNKAALAGKVILKDQLGKLVSNAHFNLYKRINNGWKLISEITTDINGEFAVTQELYHGRYELRPVSSKYEGKLVVDIDDKPERDLIFEVTIKK
ncbi:MAG: prealbumin-like fold domain-containing protein [Bdellovibrionaceae bacterium]|nr:prealbumin-like fold domain-containing protein [Bdellovibrio sp.]